MPVCEGCGGSYDDEFKFCPNCGRANTQSTPKVLKVEVSDETEWETCEIVWSIVEEAKGFLIGVKSGKIKWWAQALNKEGYYNAGNSEVIESTGNVFPLENNLFSSNKPFENFMRAKDGLIQKLAKNGWVMTLNDRFHPQFRRKVKRTQT